MEIKNDTISEQNSAQATQDPIISCENSLSYNINNISEEQKSDTLAKSIENTGKNDETGEDVFDLDYLLTKFIEKYESARKSNETAQNPTGFELKEDFSTLFPQRSLETELENPDFKLFCKYKGKNTTYGECYKDFCSLVSSIESKTEKRVLSSLANKEAGVGSLSSEEKSTCDYFTKEQVLRMNSDQIRQNYNKIRESQQKW